MKTKKRSLVSLLLLIMVFVFSLGVASCKKGGGDDDADSSSSSTIDYAEEGVYYFNAVDNQEYLVTLDGDTFTMWLGGEMKNGQYTYDGNNLNLAFAGTDTATATLSDGVLSLTYNGNAYRFLKKINYTVTYHTNGGSEVAAATVLNGQTLAKPADPQLSGYTFISWYKDAEYTMPFAFGTEPVTSNMTLYARFAETVVGGNEYVATLNVDGAQYAMQSTIGGVLYDLPTPQKDGAVFAGWWVSVDGDATKLSYKYDGQTLAANASLYGVWVSAAPAVSVSATGVSWSVQTAASAYRVKITAPNGDIVYNREVGSTNVEYDFASGVAGTYTVEVTANDNTSTVYYANKTLDKVSLFSVSEPSVLLFNAVENAEKYLIKIVCGNESHVHTAVDNGLSTNYNFSNCEMCPGGIQFQVTAVAKGYANSVSDVYSYSRDLAAVTGLTLDAAADKITWNAVAGATSYVVEIVKGETSTKVEVTSTSYTLQNYTGEMTIKVTPVAKAYNSPEAASVAYAKTKLVAPTNVLLSKNTLKWTAVDGAVKYVVSFNGTTYESTTNELALTSDMYVDGQESYQVSVQAVAADAVNNSAFSAAVTINYSVMNPELSYSKGVVSWSSVANAYRYAVRVNKGKEISVKGEFNSYPVTLTKAGNNTIEVRYYDEDERGSDWVSMTVYAYSITFDACGGAEVKTQYKALGDPIELPKSTLEGYNFTAWYNVPNGPENNGAIFNDTTLTTSGNMILYAYWSYESYVVTFDLDGMGTLDVDSLNVGYSRDYVLPVPVSTNSTYVFAGWYTSPKGQNGAYTDEKGVSVQAWNDARDVIVYAYWVSVLEYKKGTDIKGNPYYAVSANMRYIDRVTNIKIPETYQGEEDAEPIPVKLIDAEAFKDCKTLEVIQIPDTITAITLGTGGVTGTGSAFRNCTNLRSLEIYCVYGDHEANDHVTYYKSANGALIYSDPTNPAVKELVYVPASLTGIYSIPQGVTSIAPSLFYNNKTLQEIKVPASVNYIGMKAFYRTAAKITFIPVTEADLVADPNDETKKVVPSLKLGEQVFWYCEHTEITLPARLSPEDFNVNIFDYCNNLEKVFIQPEAVEYKESSYKTTDDGLLLQAITDTEGEPTGYWKVVFCPKARTGEITFGASISEIGESAFYNCEKITKVTIPLNITKIEKKAFYDCDALKTLVIDESVEDLVIGEQAFYGCGELQDFTIPNGVIGLDKGAFKLCTTLTKIIIPAGMQYIGDEAFMGCTAITSITFVTEEAVNLTIGQSAFKNADNVKTLTIPTRVTAIGAEAFYNCDLLETVTFDDPADAEQNLTIGEEAFYNCDRLTTITMPARLKSVGLAAFGGNNNLTEVTLNCKEGVQFANAAFLASATSKDYYIKTINIGVNCPTIAIAGVFGLGVTNINVAEDHASYKSVDGVLYDKEVTEIVYFPSTKTDYTLPDTITVIGDRVFYGSTLESITISYKLTEIGESAFADSKSLKSVIFTAAPEGAKDAATTLMIGVKAFQNCSKLETFEFPARTTEIGDYAFSGCANFPENVVLPEGFTTIGADAFSSADNIKTFSLPSTLVNVGVREISSSSTLPGYTLFYAFNSDGLQSFTVHADNPIFAAVDGVLYRKGQIDTITYADGSTKVVTYVKDAEKEEDEVSRVTSTVLAELVQVPEAKAGTITVPSTVWKLGDYAFTRSSSSKAAKAEALVWENNTLNIPSNVEFTFGRYTFYYHGSLKNVTLPMGMTVIPQDAFYYCHSLETINIPYTVTSIEPKAFYNCKSLTNVNIAEAPEGEDAKYPLTLEDGSSYSSGGGSGGSTTYYGAFAYVQSPTFTSIKLPKRTVYIGDYSFTASSTSNVDSYLTSIEIPANVTAIGKYVFAYNKYLTTLTFAAGSKLTEIGSNAFYQSGLTGEIVIPNTVMAFGYTTSGSGASAYTSSYTFAYTNITKITLPESLTLVPGYMFSNCKNLEEVVFGENSQVEKFDTGAFQTCTSLEAITIPASVKTMGTSVFSGCTALATVTFEEGSALEAIGNSAFVKTGLTSFKFPVSSATNGITLGTALFSGCRDLTTIELSKSVVNISNVLNGCSSLQVIKVAADNEHFMGDPTLPLLYNKVQDGVDEEGDPVYIYTTIQYSFGAISGDTFKVNEGVKVIGSNAFAGQAFKKIELPKSLETIEAKAFYKCMKLEEIVFADGCNLTEIGESAFQYCISLKNLKLPSKVETIGKNAFASCEALESVIWSDALVTIGVSAFDNCVSLTNVKTATATGTDNCFPATLETLDQYAFRYTALTGKLIIPDSVERLASKSSSYTYSTGGNIFQQCHNITEVVLPDTLIHIGGNVFEGCRKLQKVNIPAGLKLLGTCAFKNCHSLQNVTLPDQMEDVNSSAFMNCTSLTKVKVPELTASAATWRFAGMYEGCTNVTEVEIAKGVTQLGSKMFAGTAITAFDLSWYQPTTYPTNLFKDCASLQSVDFGTNSTTTALGDYMFAGCTSLKTVTLPTSLNFLGKYTFQNSGIESIAIPAGVKTIASSKNTTSLSTKTYTFENCVNLKTITFGQDITHIGYGIFKGCTSLEEISLPKVVKFGQEAFMNSGLKTADFPLCTGGATDAFNGCTKLTTVNWPAATDVSSTRVFQGCTSLSSVTFGTKVTSTSMGASYFEGCTSLKTIDLTKLTKVKTIGNRVFYGCTSLESIVIPKAVTTLGNSSIKRQSGTSYYGNTFENCTNLKSVTFETGSALTKIGGEKVFAGCSSLTSITLPANLAYIGYDAFKGTGLTSIHLSAKIANVYQGAFDDCAALKTITIDSANRNFAVGSDGFVYDKEGKTLLYVPAGLLESGIVDLSDTTIESLGTSSDYNFGTVFSGNDNITRIILPTTLVKIGSGAFMGMEGLLNLEVPASVKSIDSYAFADCTKLRNLTFAEGSEIIYVAKFAFYNTPSIGGENGEYNTTFTLAQDPSADGSEAANGYLAPLNESTFENSGFKTVNLPLLSEIGKNAFRGSKITSIVVPEGVTKISDYAFADCVNLVTVSLPTTLTTINANAFENTAITEITIPENVQTIGKTVFAGSALQTFKFEKLADGVVPTFTAGDYSVFDGCTDLETVILPEGMTELPKNMFLNCTALKNVTLPSTLTKIGDYAFMGCTALESIELPDIANINDGLFKNCTSLSSLTIPETVTQIEYDAFENCTALKKLIIPDTVQKGYRRLFAGWKSDQTVYFRVSLTTLCATTDWNMTSLTLSEKVNTGYIDSEFKTGFVGSWIADTEANFVFDYAGN